MLQTDPISEVPSPAQRHEMRAKFNDYGYVVVRGVLDPQEDLQPVIDEYAGLVDRLARQWHGAGELSSDFAHLPFDQRVIAIMAETGDRLYDHFRIFFNPPSATKADTPLHVGPAIFGLLTNPKLLDVIENFVGPEIYVNPVNVVRVKPPEDSLPKDRNFHIGLTASWWHQDQGVFADDITDVEMLTVWVSLGDVTKEMGCLQMVPGSHKGDLSIHCRGSSPSKVGIPDQLLGPQRHYVEMKAGDVHFHHRRIQHGSLRNDSNRLRFSFDLRYQPATPDAGHSAGVPPGFRIPGFVARSHQHPETEMHDWRAWQQLQEETRSLLMSLDWKQNPAHNQFVSEHPYCL